MQPNYIIPKEDFKLIKELIAMQKEQDGHDT